MSSGKYLLLNYPQNVYDMLTTWSYDSRIILNAYISYGTDIVGLIDVKTKREEVTKEIGSLMHTNALDGHPSKYLLALYLHDGKILTLDFEDLKNLQIEKNLERQINNHIS